MAGNGESDDYSKLNKTGRIKFNQRSILPDLSHQKGLTDIMTFHVDFPFIT